MYENKNISFYFYIFGFSVICWILENIKLKSLIIKLYMGVNMNWIFKFLDLDLLKLNCF